RIAAIASMAGSTWKDPARCTPAQPVSVVEIHGDADEVVPFAGGRIPYGDGGAAPGGLPGARETVSAWAERNACKGPLERAEPGDLDPVLAGSETMIERYGGCRAG